MNTNPILIKKYRGDVLESFHRGVICLVKPDGTVGFSAGNIHQICFPRSAVKFFQQIPLLESGAAEAFKLTPEEIAVACASHSGEAVHLAAARSILRKAGLTEEHLQCGAHLPFDDDEKNRMLIAQQAPARIHNNCSGKHAAFLALAQYLGCSLEDYLKPNHPIQQTIKQIIAEMHECKAEDISVAIDGCGAPIFGLSVYAQAVGYKNLCNLQQYPKKRQDACRAILSAAMQHPYMIAGNKRYCTEMMQATKGKVFGKTGADGVYSLGFPDKGIGVNLKIDDGAWGMQFHVAQAIVEKMVNADFSKLSILKERIIYNWAHEKTGTLTVNEEVINADDEKVG